MSCFDHVSFFVRKFVVTFVSIGTFVAVYTNKMVQLPKQKNLSETKRKQDRHTKVVTGILLSRGDMAKLPLDAEEWKLKIQPGDMLQFLDNGKPGKSVTNSVLQNLYRC